TQGTCLFVSDAEEITGMGFKLGPTGMIREKSAFVDLRLKVIIAVTEGPCTVGSYYLLLNAIALQRQ
ncbi:MAG: hypothetical protein P8Z73_02915, partial [Desulfobacteraceae bacterium]